MGCGTPLADTPSGTGTGPYDMGVGFDVTVSLTETKIDEGADLEEKRINYQRVAKPSTHVVLSSGPVAGSGWQAQEQMAIV